MARRRRARRCRRRSRRCYRAPARGRGAAPFVAALGCCRRWSRGGSACRRDDAGMEPLGGRRRAHRCARSRGAPGASSRPSSDRRTTRSRRTTSRRTRSRSSRIAPRRPTSASTCSRPSPRTTSAGSGSSTPSSGSRRRSTRSNGLERFRGHFYNWYDTRDLRPLEPKYVSTVDSGNLAGHLHRAARGVSRAARSARSLGPEVLAGIADALLVLREALRSLSDDRRTLTVTRQDLDDALDGRRRRARRGSRDSPVAWAARLLDPRDARRHHGGHRAHAARGARRSPRRRAGRLGGGGARGGREPRARPRHARCPGRDVSRREARPRPRRSARADCRRWRTLRTRASACAPRSATTSIARRCADELSSASSARAPPSTAGSRRSVASRTRMFRRDGLRLPLRPDAQALLDRLPRGRRRARLRTATTCSPPRRGSRASSRSPRATSRRALVPARPRADAGRPRLGAGLVVGLDVRVPDAVAGDARAGRQPARADLPRSSCGARSQYGAERGVPWGISESAYNARDLELTYQYSSFGVPGLGLKRGLSEDLVVAPYATALAAMVDPAAAARELRAARRRRRRAAATASTRRSTTRRRACPRASTVAIVRAYMAHHQGMTLVALANVLHDGAMRARFHAEPIVQATELLLQERTPRDVARRAPARRGGAGRAARARARPAGAAPLPIAARPDAAHAPALERPLRRDDDRRRLGLQPLARPRGHALARGRHRATAGASTSSCATSQSGERLVGGLPADAASSRTATRSSFSEDRAEIRRRDGAIATTLEVVVSPEDDAEVRRVSLTNLGARAREIELTSYAELVLAPPAADAAHPGVLEPVRPDRVRARRRARCSPRAARARRDERRSGRRTSSSSKARPSGGAQFETDRARFLGRGRGVRTPMSVIDGRPLSNTAGAVLDPIFSLRRRVRLAAGRDGARRVLDAGRAVARARRSTWPTSTTTRRPSSAPSRWPGRRRRCELHHLGIEPDEAHLFQRLAEPRPLLRPVAAAVVRRARAQRPAASRRSGRTASPATCRSCSSGSTRPRIWRSSASCCARTSTGG